MRRIGTIDTESQARVFRSYLLTLGIHSDLEQNHQKTWTIWVHEETRIDEATNELEAFLSNPRDPKYQAAVTVGEQIEKTRQRENKDFKNRQVDLRTNWHLSQNSATPLTMLLIVISVAVTVFLHVDATEGFIRTWFSIMAYVPEGNRIYFHITPLHEVRQGQIWRLITPIFLHFSILHILFNMMWLRLLGGSLEAVEGTWKLALHVVVYAIAGNVLQFFMTGPGFGGMSGVVYGLFAYTWLVGKYTHEPRYFIDPVTVGFMIFWFFSTLR